MQLYNPTFVVHAQQGFDYASHKDVNNIEKYVSQSSFQLFAPRGGKLLFHLGHYIKSDIAGNFDSRDIFRHAQNLGIDLDTLFDVEVTLVGGDFEACLQNVFYELRRWLTDNAKGERRIILPKDAVFSVRKPNAVSTLRQVSESDRAYLEETIAVGYRQAMPCNITETDESFTFDYPDLDKVLESEGVEGLMRMMQGFGNN